MRHICKATSVLLPLVMLTLAGCGGGSSGSSSADPFSSNTAAADPGSRTIFGNISTATGKTGIAVTTDVAAVDANNGQVLATANVVSGGVPVPGVPVTFAILAPINGPATIETGLTTVTTDSNGAAITRITTGNTLATTNVIISATTTIGTQTAVADTAFQIVRGTGAISFGTVTLTNSEKYNSAATAIVFRQLVPFKVTDSNGNPRVGVPVTLSIYSQSNTSPVIIDFLKGGVVELTANTVTTDSTGSGIFNTSVTAPVPATPGFVYTDTIVLRAVTNDSIPLTEYGGVMVASKREPAPDTPAVISPIVISPTTGFFATTDVAGATMQFTISGGSPPYTVAATNPARVSVVLQPDGVTAIATLLDASQWTGSVSFSVLDKNGTGASLDGFTRGVLCSDMS